MIDESASGVLMFKKKHLLVSLRLILPSGTPIMAFLAMMTLAVLKEVQTSLTMGSASSFEINLGND
jgi:hypothetical protein